MGIKVKFMSALKEVTGTSFRTESFFNTLKSNGRLVGYIQLKDELFYPDGTIDYLQISLNGRLSWPEKKYTH